MNGIVNIYRTYNDLCLEINILETQIEYAMLERKRWWFGGKLFHEVSLDNAAERVDKLSERIKEMHLALDHRKKLKFKLDGYLLSLEGIEHKVAYKRYIEGKTLPEIADELGYSLAGIKKISRSIKEYTFSIPTY
ncbi:MAG: hypothetical protein LPK26_17430 [Bacillaceae bacterium]|nr:hypothetical protein [Bacillaceae bacterium]